jgi:hypothetical protein
VGLTTYDAKDPDTSYPPIRDVRPPDYTAHTSRFNGKIHWVRIDLGEDAKDADHYIDADERLRVAMARQ